MKTQLCTGVISVLLVLAIMTPPRTLACDRATALLQARIITTSLLRQFPELYQELISGQLGQFGVNPLQQQQQQLINPNQMINPNQVIPGQLVNPNQVIPQNVGRR